MSQNQPFDQKRLDEFIKELQSPTDQTTRAGVELAAKKEVILKGIHQAEDMNADEVLFWMTMEFFWKLYQSIK